MLPAEDRRVDPVPHPPSLRSGVAETFLLLATATSILLIAGDGLPRPERAAFAFIGVVMGVAATAALLASRRVSVAARTAPGGLASSQASLALGLLLASMTIGWLAVMVGPPIAVLATAAISYRVLHEVVLLSRPRLCALSSGVVLASPVLVCGSAVAGHLPSSTICLLGTLVSWTLFHWWLTSPPHVRGGGGIASPDVPPTAAAGAVLVGVTAIGSFSFLATSLAGWTLTAVFLALDIALILSSRVPRLRGHERGPALRLAGWTSFTYPIVLFASAAIEAVLT